MGSVLSYSGLSTKIRAMQSRLVTDEQLEEIVQLPNVPQVTAYLNGLLNIRMSGPVSMKMIFTAEQIENS